jgi:hypothetical protein
MSDSQKTTADQVLKLGRYKFTCEWGGEMVVLPLNDCDALCIELNEEGTAIAMTDWHLEPTEQFAEPLRHLRDEHYEGVRSPHYRRFD